MAKEAGLADVLFISGYDVSGDAGAMRRISTSRPSLDVTGINTAGGRERVQGPMDGAIEFFTYFNDADDQEHEILKTPATGRLYLMYTAGGVRGDPCAMLVALQINYDWTRPGDGSLIGEISALSEGAVGGTPLNKAIEWGTLITNGKVTSASGTTNPTGEVTASSASGYSAQAQIFSLTSGTPTITIQHSSDTTNGDDGVWATLEAFTINTAQTAERIEGTGTVNKGLRIQITGTYSTLVYAVALRRGIPEQTVAYV